MKAQGKEVINELLKEKPVEMKKESPHWKAGGGFWLEDYGLSTRGDLNNHSYIIPQEPKGRRSHGRWISESLEKGYIVIVRQADAPNIPCDFDENKRQAAEGRVHGLFKQGQDPV